MVQLFMRQALALADRKKSDEWQETPAKTAIHLSRGNWRSAPHHELISDRIAEIKNHPIFLIISEPPRHGKSELVSHWTPIWFLKRWPWKRVILCSYQSSFAAEFGGMAKESIVENREELDLSLSLDTKAKDHWKLKGYGGGMTAVGIGGSITGRGADLIIIDDPVKSQKEANSITYREMTKQWYRATLRTRLQPGGSIIILMTRWHEDDLAGWLMKASQEELSFKDNWEIVNLPALAEPTEKTADPLGREEGEALWPEMYDRNALLTLKESVGPYWWTCLYQGRPRPEGGGLFKEPWFGFFDPTQEIKYSRVIQFWDTAFKKDQRANRTACITAAEHEKGYDILDCWYGRPEFPELQKMLKTKYSQWHPDRVLVEDKASGTSLIQQIRRDTKVPIIAIKAIDDKVARANTVTGICEAERVRLPMRAPWIADFISEVCGFPAIELDDITDSFVYALMALKPRRIGQGTTSTSIGKKKSAWKE